MHLPGQMEAYLFHIHFKLIAFCPKDVLHPTKMDMLFQLSIVQKSSG